MTDTPTPPDPDRPADRDDPPAGEDLTSGDPLARDDAPAGGDPPRAHDVPAAGDPPPAHDAHLAGDPPSAYDAPAPGDRPAAHDAPAGAGPEYPFAAAAVPPSMQPPPRRLTRSSSDRLLGGVAGGLGRHLNVDPLIFRIAFVVLAFAGGVGVLAYLVGLIAVPADDDATPQRWGLARTAGAGLLAAAAVAVIVPNWFWGPALPGLAVAGVVIYLLIRAVRDDGASHLSHVAARIALAIALIALAAAGFAAAAAGSALGGGILIAGLVIALGVGLVGGAFRRGGARWLIVPAFVLAIPLGVVSAADLDLEGDWGERTFRPAAAAELDRGYRMGVGHMQVDLRGVDLPPGRTDLPLKLGIGELEVAVPEGVCVTYDVRIGLGDVVTLDGISDEGVDLDVTGDAVVPAGVSELHVEADLGVGEVRIGPDFRSPRFGDFQDVGFLEPETLNAQCRSAP